MDLNYIMETILNIMIINLIGIIIITFTIGLHMLCELMIKKYMRKLIDQTTQTDNRKYSEDDLENTYDLSNNYVNANNYINANKSIYNDSAYQYTKKLKTRSRY
jgi:Ser-tRNA(Ala) deacylase AlaX